MDLPAPIDVPDANVFQAMYRALDASTAPILGPARARLLMIPLRDEQGGVTGGLWGHTLFKWLSIEMLVVPDDRRRQGIGSALVATAEAEARARGCVGAHLDTFSFQPIAFYNKLGFSIFGVLHGYPPGYSRLYFRKHWGPPA